MSIASLRRSLGAAALVFALTSGVALEARAQQSSRCPGGYAGCARAAIAYQHRQGLPVEFQIDTDWQPRNSPVQVRFRAALVGNTELRMAGSLVGSWPEPMSLSVEGDPMGGSLSTDWGVQLSARIRLALEVAGRTYNWEGNVPYVPQIDFRATGRTVFDPWAWTEVRARGMTMRQHLADIALTDAFISIPGVRGGLSFDAQADIDAGWRSTRFTFGTAADPITEQNRRTLAIFTVGPFVEYQPTLEGTLSFGATVRVYPSIYVSLLGRRWMVDLFTLPIPLGPFPRALQLGPPTARLGLPDIFVDRDAVDFGEVRVGGSAERMITLENRGEGDGAVMGTEGDGAFELRSPASNLPMRARSMLLVSYTPVRPGPAEGTVVVSTNDPDTPRLRIAVRGTGIGAPVVTPVTDAGVVVDDAGGVVDDAGEPVHAAEDGGCNCRVGGASRGGVGDRGRALVFGAVALALVARRRRGRRER